MDIYGYGDRLMMKLVEMLFQTMAQDFPRVVQESYCMSEKPESVLEEAE